jgi:AraC family L-rhamnose operon regulatory protein RhaS
MDTIGMNYYKDLVFPVSITNKLAAIDEMEAAEYYKIIYFKSGTYRFKLNGKEFVITGSYALCLNERDGLSLYDDVEGDILLLLFQPKVINVNFNMDLINDPEHGLSETEFQDLYYIRQFRHDAELYSKLLPLRTMDSAYLEHKLQLLQELLVNQDTYYWPCRSRSYLFEILFSLARQEEHEEPVRSIQFYNGFSKLAVDVIYYLQSSYSQKITIEKLAEEFHTNRTTLLNDFKKYTGQSVNRYLNQLRLNMASTLLRDTELPVEEICERTGFNDISYFSKAFKKGLSCTPSEYRRLNHNT